MKKRRVKGVEAPSKPARSSSTSDKEDAQAQGTHVAAAEAREDAKKARVRGEGVAGGDFRLVAILGRGVHGRRSLQCPLRRRSVGRRRPLELEGFGETEGLREKERVGFPVQLRETKA
ncbi:hypothetical protein EUGRSUZ_G02319 [Eucalyptus grandis]|uniref:Uncharacterized protein n=2 Tax=Eucalyptus grandis TaxID=71139 RepID=A0ACC3K857_EUCGR|nr:hypothetical protein EUGRSUZ_G02319 [Eucalyptus grandis]